MIYCILADGFEEIEALTPIDMLRRAGLNVTTMALTENQLPGVAVGAHGIKVMADMILPDIPGDDIEMLI